MDVRKRNFPEEEQQENMTFEIDPLLQFDVIYDVHISCQLINLYD